jgi:hypothetical protein
VVRPTTKRIYVANGVFGDTLDVSTLPSFFLIFLAAFFAFLATFRTSLLILDIRCGPPTFAPAWPFGRASQERTTSEGMDSKSRMEQAIFSAWQSISVNSRRGRCPARFIGVVYAADEKAALETAIAQFGITARHEQKKLMVRPQR